MATVIRKVLANKKAIRENEGKVVSKAEASKILNERTARANHQLKIWENVDFLKNSEKAKSAINESNNSENTAFYLTNQARVLRHMTEEQVANDFMKVTPANLLKLVVMSMGNLNRGKIFTEFAMESPRDVFIYIRPFFARPFDLLQDGSRKDNMNSRTSSGAEKGKEFGFDEDTSDWTSARKALYETTEDRFATELANAPTASTTEVTFAGNEFGENGELYIDGYFKLYVKGNEKKVIAIQDPSTKAVFPSGDYPGVVVTHTADTNTFKIEGLTLADGEEVQAYGRFDAETDYTGKYLGEVELRMSMKTFIPRRTAIGVSWTQLTDIILDSGFNQSAQDLLLDFAAATIHQQLDYQAVKMAYAIAKTNFTKDASGNVQKFAVEFDAKYSNSGTGAKDSYADNAQTFTTAIQTMGDKLYNDIHRGTINKLVCGVSAGTYITLLAGFSSSGKQDANGIYKFGTLDGIELYKAPTDVIPSNEILAIYKNDKIQQDAALVFGTLVPFTTTNVLPRKNFYKEAGLATYGDVGILEKKFLGIISIKDLKESVDGEGQTA